MHPDREWEGFAVAVTTRQGYSLAAGGICERGTAAYWKERFYALAAVKIDGDIRATDLALARALQDLAEDSLCLAGCSVNTGTGLPAGIRTGGVLGCPREAPASAKDACEELPDGFSLFTAAGGPGLAALAEPATTERAVAGVRELGKDASATDIGNCLASFGLKTFLFVADGTGADARGCVIAGNPDGFTAVGLRQSRITR